MKQISLFLFLLFTCICIWRCDDAKKVELEVSDHSQPTAPPTITNLVANPDIIGVGGTTTVKCNVDYPDDSTIEYSWESEAGQFKGSDPKVFCWDKDGHLKSGMLAVFDGKTIADNWSGNTIPGGPGTPEIKFTFVPEIGSFNNLKGQVQHVLPSDYKIAIYILVAGGWWTKPTFAQPLTTIQRDGSWTVDITTGGIDEKATQIVAYLVPKDYAPPKAGGNYKLPSELEEHSVAKAEVKRN